MRHTQVDPAARAAQRDAIDVRTIVAALDRYREHRAVTLQRTKTGLHGARIDGLAEALDIHTIAALALPDGTEEVEQLLRDVRKILRLRVREAGWQAFARGGCGEMRRLANLVEDAGNVWHSAILDKWWDGIGEWVA